MRGGVDREEGAGTARGRGPGGGPDEGMRARPTKRESMRQRRHRIWLRGGWGMKKVGRRVCWEKRGVFGKMVPASLKSGRREYNILSMKHWDLPKLI
jgi:hypothetical protein